MRRTIAALIAGLVLGMSGTAVAASSYWESSGTRYECSGIRTGMTCDHNSGYGVAITRNYVAITYHGDAAAGCNMGRGPSNCFTYK